MPLRKRRKEIWRILRINGKVSWLLEIIEDSFIVSWCSKRVTRCNIWGLAANSQNGPCEDRRAWNPSRSLSKLSFVREISKVGRGPQNPGSKVECTGVGQRMTSYYLEVQRGWITVTPVVSGRTHRKLQTVETCRMESIRLVLTVHMQGSTTQRSACNNKVIWSCHMIKQEPIQVNTEN